MIMLLIACSNGEISVSPSTLDFGEVDFNAEPMDCDGEDGGCAPTTVTIRNEGEDTLTVTGTGWDPDYLCIEGFESETLDLGTLPAGAAFDLVIAVCGKDPGYGTLISGDLRFTPDSGDAVTLPWSFTPIRDLGDDTGG